MAAFSARGTGVARADQLVLRAAVSAYLGRYRGQIRLHTESDLGVFLRWCVDQDRDPRAVVRVDIERYVRWLQVVRCYQPSTVSRRLSVVVGFYRVCVIDGILPHSPANYVRRPTVPAESPTLGLGHLQFEALITTARRSANLKRLGVGRASRPARPAELRSVRGQHRRPGRGTRPPGTTRAGQGGKVVLTTGITSCRRKRSRSGQRRMPRPW